MMSKTFPYTVIDDEVYYRKLPFVKKEVTEKNKEKIRTILN